MKQTFWSCRPTHLLKAALILHCTIVQHSLLVQTSICHIRHHTLQHAVDLLLPLAAKSFITIITILSVSPSSQLHAAVIVEVHRFVDFRGGIPSMEVNPDWNGVRFNLQRKGQIEWNIATVWKYHQVDTDKYCAGEISILLVSPGVVPGFCS